MCILTNQDILDEKMVRPYKYGHDENHPIVKTNHVFLSLSLFTIYNFNRWKLVVLGHLYIIHQLNLTWRKQGNLSSLMAQTKIIRSCLPCSTKCLLRRMHYITIGSPIKHTHYVRIFVTSILFNIWWYELSRLSF